MTEADINQCVNMKLGTIGILCIDIACLFCLHCHCALDKVVMQGDDIKAIFLGKNGILDAAIYDDLW